MRVHACSGRGAGHGVRKIAMLLSPMAGLAVALANSDWDHAEALLVDELTGRVVADVRRNYGLRQLPTPNRHVDGSLSLHLALANNADVELVRRILEAFPEAATEKDQNGDLPMHVALRYDAPSEVYRWLLGVHPGAASEKTRNGSLPLHLAVRGNVAPEVFTLLLSHFPTAIGVRTGTHDMPLHLALRYSTPGGGGS
eukprot:COSAG05_NODE_3600_length_1966_cov_29.942153_4_plen_198_part_00